MIDTVKIRIAVAVDEKGQWVAFGIAEELPWESSVEEQARSDLQNADICFGTATAMVGVAWVEADVPIPDSDLGTHKGGVVAKDEG